MLKTQEEVMSATTTKHEAIGLLNFFLNYRCHRGLTVNGISEGISNAKTAAFRKVSTRDTFEKFAALGLVQKISKKKDRNEYRLIYENATGALTYIFNTFDFLEVASTITPITRLSDIWRTKSTTTTKDPRSFPVKLLFAGYGLDTKGIEQIIDSDYIPLTGLEFRTPMNLAELTSTSSGAVRKNLSKSIFWDKREAKCYQIAGLRGYYGNRKLKQKYPGRAETAKKIKRNPAFADGSKVSTRELNDVGINADIRATLTKNHPDLIERVHCEKTEYQPNFLGQHYAQRVGFKTLKRELSSHGKTLENIPNRYILQAIDAFSELKD